MHRAAAWAALLAAIVLAACATAELPPTMTPTPAATPTPLPQRAEGTISAALADGTPVTVNTLIDRPEGHDPTSGTRYPAEIHLPHGGTVGGTHADLRAIGRGFGIQRSPEAYPVVIGMAQLPEEATWYELSGAVLELRQTLIEVYAADPDRIYLTGYSNGGRGSLEVASQHPGEFTALAVIAGFYTRDLEELCGLGDLPVHLFHGARDDLVSVEGAEAVAAQIEDCGGSVTLTINETAGHYDLWARLMTGSAIYDWLLAQG